jgi:hypothetical protein
MEKDLAKIVALTAFRSSADLNNLIPLLKEHCSEDECRTFGIAIATASSAIGQEILQKIFALYPEISMEFDKQIGKYGHPF